MDEAEQAFVAAVENHDGAWSAAVDLAGMLERAGKDQQARSIYIAVYQESERGGFRTPTDLRAGARSAAKLGRFREANDAYRLAHELDPGDVETLFQWAELFRTKYNDAEARRTYEDALARNPHHAPSLVGLARAVQSFERREELAQRALAIHQRYPEALNVLAGLRILDGLYDDAETLSRQALDTDPTNLESLAHLASSMLLRGDTTNYRQVEERAGEAHSRAGVFYMTAAENATHRFRYRLAATLLERAVEADSQNALARAELGLALLRLGRRSEARRHLESAFEEDPYNLFASNTLTLIDEYERFERLQSPRFDVYVHEDEHEVLGPLILDVAEASFDSLRKRYPYDPSGRITIEAYNDGNDFAVRVAGVPHRGLLGVSFGDVVAVNSPAAHEGRSYNWARTLWHEIAHTMAIGVSEHRVPRWFTEGLSVYEEGRGRPEWSREMELAFLSAYASGRLLPLGDIERGFTRPEFPGQVLLSYYHAGQIVAFLAEQYGFEAIIDVLEAYRDGAGTDEALHAATGLRIDELDRQFMNGVEARHQMLAEAVDGLPDVLENEQVEVETVSGAAGPLFQHLRSGAGRLEEGDLDGAKSAFERAIDIYPDYVGPGNAYQGLAEVYREQADSEALIQILEEYAQIAEHADRELIELADLYAERSNEARAAAILERSLHVAPYDPDVRRRLADLYEGSGMHEAAVRHRTAELALEPSDRAGAYLRLAQSLYGSRQFVEAKRAVLQSLEIAPDYREAQQLLLEIVE